MPVIRRRMSRFIAAYHEESWIRYRQDGCDTVFLLRFDDGDDLLGDLGRLARETGARAVTTALLGGMRSAGIVTGPREADIPPAPQWTALAAGQDIVGFGCPAWRDGEPEPIVLPHGAFERGSEGRIGCLRKDGTVYLVVEAVIPEITGVDAHKSIDERSGPALLGLQ